MTPELRRAHDGWALALQDHPLVNADDLIGEVMRDEAQLWRSENADVFTRIEGGVLSMGPFAGDVEEGLRELLPKIERWAAAAGCTDILIQAGRQGFSRLLRRYGYEEAAVILRKKL